MKKSKKIISMLLASVMIFVLGLPVFAAENNADCPVVHIAGIDSSKIYTDKDNPTTQIAVPSQDVLVSLAEEKLIPALLLYSIDRDTEKLAGEFSAFANEAFADWFNDSDGTPAGNSGVVSDYPASVSKNAKLNFEYDWRADPIVIAEELNNYIEYVTEKSGSDKVAVTCHSLGSVVIITYLTLYGNDKISGIVFDTPAAYGVTSVGDLMCGKVNFNKDSLSYYLKFFLGEGGYDDFMMSLVDIFDMAGVTDLLTVFLDSVMVEIGPSFYRETLAPLFGYWPSIWSMITDEQIDDAMEYFFGTLCEGKDLSALRAKIENYNSLIRSSREETLKDFDAVGKVAVISRYGGAALPIVNDWSLINDTVIETVNSSFGANTAPYGDYFSDEYIEGKDMKYISPDRTVDASTCLFPEKTWFIKNSTHQETAVSGRYYSALLFSDEELTCDDTSLPRFLSYDRSSGEITADTSEPEKIKDPSPFERLINFLVSLFKKIAEFFKGVFNK